MSSGHGDCPAVSVVLLPFFGGIVITTYDRGTRWSCVDGVTIAGAGRKAKENVTRQRTIVS